MCRTDFEDRNFLIRRFNQSRHVDIIHLRKSIWEPIKLFRLMFKRPLPYLYVCAKYINLGANRLVLSSGKNNMRKGEKNERLREIIIKCFRTTIWKVLKGRTRSCLLDAVIEKWYLLLVFNFIERDKPENEMKRNNEHVK